MNFIIFSNLFRLLSSINSRVENHRSIWKNKKFKQQNWSSFKGEKICRSFMWCVGRNSIRDTANRKCFDGSDIRQSNQCEVTLEKWMEPVRVSGSSSTVSAIGRTNRKKCKSVCRCWCGENISSPGTSQKKISVFVRVPRSKVILQSDDPKILKMCDEMTRQILFFQTTGKCPQRWKVYLFKETKTAKER